MRPFYIQKPTLFILFPLLYLSIACDKDKCDKTIEPQYELGIRAEIKVLDSGGNPVEGHTVRIEMQKTHCDGSQGPDLVAEGETASNGIYNPGGTWSFKMNNSEDFIEIRMSVGGATIGGITRVYRYSDFKQYAGSIYTHEETFYLE